MKPLKNSQVEVSWEYPDSWSTPHSYFSLKFFVRIQRKKEKMKETEEGCNQVGFMQPMLGPLERSWQPGACLRTRTVLRALHVNHTQPIQSPKGSQYCCHLSTEARKAQRGYVLPTFFQLEQWQNQYPAMVWWRKRWLAQPLQFLQYSRLSILNQSCSWYRNLGSRSL